MSGKNLFWFIRNSGEVLIADLFLFCCERDFMLSLSGDKDAEVTEALNSTSRYLDDLLNIDNTYFDCMVNYIYPSELQLDKANSSDAEALFLDYFRWFHFFQNLWYTMSLILIL